MDLATITQHCFNRMNRNILAYHRNEQHGGGINFDSIIPYMLANNITKLKLNTAVPAGILWTVTGILTDDEFDANITASSILTPGEIQQINYTMAQGRK